MSHCDQRSRAVPVSFHIRFYRPRCVSCVHCEVTGLTEISVKWRVLAVGCADLGLRIKVPKIAV